jgi:thymidylate kinase
MNGPEQQSPEHKTGRCGGVRVGAPGGGRRPKPPVIAFMGLDGAGKSTQAALFETCEIERGGVPVRIHHGSTMVPGLRQLKYRYHGAAIRWLHRRGGREEGSTTHRLAGQAVGRGWYVMVLYFLLGSLTKSLWFSWRHRRRVTILDRCFLDDVVKVRWRLGDRSRLSNWLIRLTPMPDLVIVLEADPSITFERKKAVTCTYAEYLAKRTVLQQVLNEATQCGWKIHRIPIDGLSVGEVHNRVLSILHPLQKPVANTE